MSNPDILLRIQYLTSEIAKERIKYAESIKKNNGFEESKTIFLQIKNLEQQKKELEFQLSSFADLKS